MSVTRCEVCKRPIGPGQYGVFCTCCGAAYDRAVAVDYSDNRTLLTETIRWVARRVRRIENRKPARRRR